jgi:ABC-type branched-subunit amino acid transport system ATPase component
LGESEELPDLMLEEVTVRFGGLVAVDDVSLRAPAATVTGLIGPNGAGKTTLFNACCGLVQMAKGAVRLGGRRLNHHSTAGRAALGLGRTFQRMELFDSMTVGENVALGPEARFSARHPWGQVVGSRRERREITRRATDALGRCGLEGLAGRVAGDLSTGQRRLVELARAMASGFRFLLLDEPSSGLDVSETEVFSGVLAAFVEDTGVGVLLVEHDMALVSKICDFTWVLDFGCLIFSGPTPKVLASPVVQAAYLGTETLEADGSMASQWAPAAKGNLQTARPGVTGDV